jgi:hypothetical protein
MTNAFVSIEKEMQRLAAATAAARKAVDQAALNLKLAEEHEQKFKQELSALAGAVGSGSKQNTQVAAPASGASGAASGAASNGGVGSQSAAPKQECVLTGRGAPQQTRAKLGWRKFLPRSTPTAWAKPVERWFKENAVNRFAFLNTDGLSKKTVKLMVKFPIDNVISTMSETMFGRSGKGGKGLGNQKPENMRSFDENLQDYLQDLLDE